MSSVVLKLPEPLRMHLVSGDALPTPGKRRWGCSALAGRAVELSGKGATATLTVGMSLVLEAQRAGDPVFWVAVRKPAFYPPDAAGFGIDLRALSVIHPPDAAAGGRAAWHLLRSGAFGLAVLDLGAHDLPAAAHARLGRLAQKHDAVVLYLTEKSESTRSLGRGLVSLRAQVERRHVGDDRFECALSALKDKRSGPGWQHAEVFQGPPGLR